MRDDEDGQIGRAVIGAVMRQILGAGRAITAHREVTLEQAALPAGGAAPAPAAQHRRAQRAVIVQSGGQVGHRRSPVPESFSTSHGRGKSRIAACDGIPHACRFIGIGRHGSPPGHWTERNDR